MNGFILTTTLAYHFTQFLLVLISESSRSYLASSLGDNDNDSAFGDGEGEPPCSRTTPINHKSLKKWRQKSQPGGGPKRDPRNLSSSGGGDPFTPISVRTNVPSPSSSGAAGGSLTTTPNTVGPLSAPSTFNWTAQAATSSSRSTSRCSESTGSSHSSGFYGASSSEGLASPPAPTVATAPTASDTGSFARYEFYNLVVLMVLFKGIKH